MKCQNLFSKKNKTNITNFLLPAEFAQRVVKVNIFWIPPYPNIFSVNIVVLYIISDETKQRTQWRSEARILEKHKQITMDLITDNDSQAPTFWNWLRWELSFILMTYPSFLLKHVHLSFNGHTLKLCTSGILLYFNLQNIHSSSTVIWMILILILVLIWNK